MTFLLIIPISLFLFAINWFVLQENKIFMQWFPRLMVLLQIAVSLFGGGLLFVANPPVEPTILLSMGLIGIFFSLPEGRALLSRFLPIDANSPIHLVALLGSLYLSGITFLTLSTQSLAELANEVDAVSIWEIIANGLLWSSIALFGVGLWSRRSGTELIERLGLRLPTVRDFGIAAAWVLPMLMLQVAIGLVSLVSNPEQLTEIGALNDALLADLDSVLEWFFLALSAAVGEELLFRGALQPILGIWFTSAIFAFIHVQYGFSPIMVLIFALGFILGMVRRRYGTTVSILVHFGYNFILGLVALAGASG